MASRTMGISSLLAARLQPSAHASSVSDSECVFLYLSTSCELLILLFRNPSKKPARMRRAMSANNVAQQTNALDVDKHMSTFLLSSLDFKRERTDRARD